MVTVGLPGAAVNMVPDHLKNQWLERLGDHNPFKTISANHDLVRATRLAWVEAAQDILKAARVYSTAGEWQKQAATIRTFDEIISDILLEARDHALDRRTDPGHSPIDAHLQTVINGVPEMISPGEHAGTGASVTSGFSGVLAGLSGWDIQEVPAIYDQFARNGLATHGGGRSRPFGELVFAAFAEIIKDPRKYPQAREAFYIAMDKLGRDIGKVTLAALQGQDAKLDTVIADLDGLQVLRNGAIRYLELLPGIAADTTATRADVSEILRIVSQRESVPLETLRAVLAEMGETVETVDPEQIAQKLTAKAGEFRALTDRLNRLSNADPEVLRLRQAAAEALSKGRFAEADAHLAAAEVRDLSGLEDLEALAQQKRLSAAESRAERGSAAKLRINKEAYREAAAHYGEAARIALAADAKTARGYERQKGESLIDLGTEFGVNSALVEAIDQFRAMLKTFRRGQDALGWASTQHNLGTALGTLGTRESGTSRLEEAVAAYRAALEEWTRERAPLEWAMTQTNLGNTLGTLGSRASGTARLEEAVAAYRAALEENTRERVPLDWAWTQTNLGTALGMLGGRESGTARLEEAVAAYRAALEEFTRARVPLDWARAKTNLGCALQKIGGRESGTARLEEAVAAYRAALEEWTRARVPLDWAWAQSNLGAALSMLGERGSGTARLEEAVMAYRAALEEWTRARVPLDWAGTQNDLGNALQAIGKRESGTACLEEAVSAYRAALEEWTRERVPLDWSGTQYNLGNTLRVIGERESGTARLEEAVAAYHAALEQWTRERVPHYWAMAQYNLGIALQGIGERESRTARLEEALAAFRATLEEWTSEAAPHWHDITQKKLASCLEVLEQHRRT
jgi:tetratricopeptide (TPR) repeat protein